jgi:4-hydroxybenzoate-CoA ligase/benzoate-CoA ligase
MIGPWVVTGDRFRRDAGGYFWYEGRSDDMLKVGANWVSPVELENVLLALKKLSRARVGLWRDAASFSSTSWPSILRR